MGDVILDETAVKVEDGFYLSKDRPNEYIKITGSRIHFVVSFKGWPGREIRYEDNEHNYVVEADNRFSIYPMRSASPIINYDWFWDPKKKSILQTDSISQADGSVLKVIVGTWSRRKERWSPQK